MSTNDQGLLEVPQKAASVEHPPFTADHAGLLKRFCRDLEARGAQNVEEMARAFVLDDYGDDGLRIYNFAPDPRIGSLDSPTAVEGEGASGGGPGTLADPGYAAMSLDCPPCAMLQGLIDAKFIDSAHGKTLCDALNSRHKPNVEFAAVQILKLARLHNAQVQRMSLNSPAKARQSGGPLLTGAGDPQDARTAYGTPMRRGFNEDPAAVEYGRKLAGVK